MASPLALISGTVVKGFGRGSKELGIPTANLPEQVVDSLPEEVKQGIYFGWTQIGDGPVYKAVMSVGWNPFYQNTKRSAEVHIIHQFENDFYGENLKMVVLGYLRPELNFTSLEALIAAIKDDIRQSEEKLDLLLEFKANKFFSAGAADALAGEGAAAGQS